MADKLLPCPFCGGEAKLIIDFAQTKDPVYCFECEDCGVLVYMDDLNDKDKSIEAWNNRPSPWHTGTPTEDGYYLCHVQFYSEYYESDEEGYDLPYWFKDGSWGDESVRVIAWQKIEPYKEKEK